MALDLKQFASKLKRYRDQLKFSVDEVATGTGIDSGRVHALEEGAAAPTGDEVLIFADFYKCDYRFFVSNEQLATFERVENLYRRFGDEFSKEDRWSVQEFLFLCDCEETLLTALGRPKKAFSCRITGPFFKRHAEAAAEQLRKHLGYGPGTPPKDVYSDFRRIGIHVFRRRFQNSNISGLTVRHPTAGPCILVNYSEDIHRQRFTAAHEAAHTLLDKDESSVSFSEWKQQDLVEIRANVFASRYLLPPSVLKRLPVATWDDSAIVTWAARLEVSTAALAYALRDARIINDPQSTRLASVRLGQELKTDPELEGLTGRSFQRKKSLLERGLSNFYVSLCFDAIADGLISNARAAETLLASENELMEMAELFHVGGTISA